MAICPVCNLKFCNNDFLALSEHFTGKAKDSDALHVMWLNRNITKTKAENEIKAYSRVDGSIKTISVLSSTELMSRKIEAYQGRGFIRDIYDLYVLTNWLDKSDYMVKSKISNFLHGIQTPVDENILSSLLYAGPVNLNFDSMVSYIRRWVNEI